LINKLVHRLSLPNGAKDQQNYFAAEALKKPFCCRKNTEINAQPVHAYPEDPGQAVGQNQNCNLQARRLIFKRRVAAKSTRSDHTHTHMNFFKKRSEGAANRVLPLRVFHVEPFWAAAEPSESSSRRSSWAAEPRREQARLLLPIAGCRHPSVDRRSSRSWSSKNATWEEGSRGRCGENEVRRRGREGGRAMRVRRPRWRWIFKTERERERRRTGDEGDMMRCCC
jgi:hypothetical protein